ncbi:enoyl-CoA-hydratase DpgB [Micromonospora sp. NPDC049044]|uniref:enoyl-CoA-hydratase DpgB n=1 Tax=unclassified Micromonospora TaxID=2617518 RepID=UPI0033CC42C6
MSVTDLAPEATAEEFALTIDSGQPLSGTLIADLAGLCDQVEDAGGDATVTIRLTGNGRPGDWPGPVGIDLVSRWEKVLRRLERSPAAVVVVADGPCAGSALEVLLIADHRAATPQFRIVPPMTDGSPWAGMFLYRLVNHLGGAHARRIVLFGAGLSAVEALDLGLLDEIVTDPATPAVEHLDGVARSELAVRRRLLLDAGSTSFDEALGMHLAACERALRRATREADTPAAAAREGA